MSAGSTLASADTLVVPASHGTSDVDALPHRGQKLAEVLREFGEPNERHAAVGGGSPKHPPITRWDYAGWSVFFERTTVVDVVVKNDPPPISHVDELQRAR